jgi:hypothetical protein
LPTQSIENNKASEKTISAQEVETTKEAQLKKEKEELEAQIKMASTRKAKTPVLVEPKKD